MKPTDSNVFQFRKPDPLSIRDEEARRRIQTSLHESLVVEAAAGTGKTTQLVSRLVAALMEGVAEVDRVVAVTFTRKAAGELKLRLREELEKTRRAVPEEWKRKNVERAIASLEEARIGTIHSFCAELLRERPVEAKIDPAFNELSEEEAPRLYDRAFKAWIQTELNQMPDALRRTLLRLANWKSYPPVSALDRIRDAGWNLVEWRDFKELWRLEAFDREAQIDQLVEAVFCIAEMSEGCRYRNDFLRKSLQPTRLFTRTVKKAELLRPRDYDDLEARLLEILREVKREKRKGRGHFADGITRDQALRAREQLLEALDLFKRQADADLAAGMQRLFQDLIQRYEDLKRRTGNLDFVDLLIRARDLVRDDASVRRHLQERFTHIFVDEFQDTDPLQAEILLLLAADDPEETQWTRVRVTPGKLFLVGDPKQSIYRFRRADVSLYQQVKQTLQEAGAAVVPLSRNFRSLQPVLESVNAAFAECMSGDPESGQPDYVPLLEHLPASDEHPSLIALPVPEPYGFYSVTMKAIDESLPDAAAAFVDWILRESGWRVRDPDNPERKVGLAPRHICILFRRFMSWGRDVTRPYVRGLDARGVPHLLVGSRSFHQREEVETFRAALTAVEWPDDELSLFAALKGPFFAIPDSLLLRFRLENGSLHPFRPLGEDLSVDFEPIKEALEFFAELHRRRNFRPIVETANRILRFTRAHAGFALRPAGDQVLANIQRVCDMARGFEMGGGISFRGYVELLEQEAEKARSAEAPVLEEGADGVRIMTLHSAKGLEFPVVILADITANLAQREPDKFVDLHQGNGLCAVRLLGCSPWELLDHADKEHRRDLAEGVRIAYVAATRARDILVVPAVADGPIDGWVAPLNDAVYPGDETRRRPMSAARLGCPAFGQVSTLQAKPRALEGAPDFSVMPGLHRPRRGRHEVVWWDPKTLKLKVDGDFGLRHRELEVLAEDPGGADQEGMRNYQEWRDRRERALRQGQEPDFDLFVVSEAPAAPLDFEASIDFKYLERPPNRPAGRRFGTLVHTLLRDAPLDAPPSGLSALARHHGRAMQADSSEIQAAQTAVSNALSDPLLLRARASSRMHRELPVMLNLEDGRTLEGTLDLAFLEEGRWIVVDFKTDADPQNWREKYERQLAWYLYALCRITGKPAKGWILGI